MDIDKIITEGNKRALRKSMSDWIENELQHEARGACEEAARHWMKQNKSKVEQMFSDEIEKRMPKIVKIFIDKAFYNIH